MSNNFTSCPSTSKLGQCFMAYSRARYQGISGFTPAPALPGFDLDRVSCFKCGEDGLGEDEMKSYTSNHRYIAAHEDCMTYMRDEEALASRVTEPMNTAFFWVNEEGKHQSKTPPTWIPSGRLTCAIGGGEIQGSVTSVPGSHQFGEQQFVCGPCVASAKSFAESMWRGCSKPEFAWDTETGERVVFIPDVEIEPGKNVKVLVSEQRFNSLHDTVHNADQSHRCEVSECPYSAVESENEQE